MKRRILKRCERCQREFVCGLFGCWCSRMDVTDTHYSNIVAHYHDCLCPSCLSQITGKPQNEIDTHFSQPDPSNRQ
ncbi:MAG: cysteine-rich CWC family protein [Nitrospirota bacterium]|nr:MAG: cysteine-rich CWC family protein [Nitrospirota bacterium]